MVWRDLGRDSINMCYDYEETRPRYVSENSVVLEMERAAFLSSLPATDGRTDGAGNENGGDADRQTTPKGRQRPPSLLAFTLCQKRSFPPPSLPPSLPP